MQEGALIAAIDMGSNSFRLEIGRLEGAQIVRMDYLKETVRQGALDENKCLTESAQQRGLECLRRFGERLRDFPGTHVRAVATQTLREAVNREEFLLQARKVLGFPIEVISGREEARLIYAGVSRLLPYQHETKLVVDIGGRSTEMIVGQGTRAIETESFKVGSVSLSMKYLPDGRYTERGFKNAQIAAAAEIEESIETYTRHGWEAAYGSSGTVGAISQLLRLHGLTDGAITLEGIRWLKDQLLKAGSASRVRLEGLKDDRKTVIAGGLAILQAIFEQFSLSRMQAAKGALRHGVMFDLLGREHTTTDVREQTVQRLQLRFGCDALQALRVCNLAVHWLTTLSIEKDSESARELSWACALHEIGMAVSHSEYHRHGAYLMEHADAAGFSQPQQLRVAELILAHRGGLRKVETLLDNDLFVAQIISLRLATLLAHARREVVAQAVSLSIRGKEYVITIDSEWLRHHPQTMHLINEEVEAWRKVSIRLIVQER